MQCIFYYSFVDIIYTWKLLGKTFSSFENIDFFLAILKFILHKEVQVDNDQAMTQSETKSHSKNRGGKT